MKMNRWNIFVIFFLQGTIFVSPQDTFLLQAVYTKNSLTRDQVYAQPLYDSSSNGILLFGGQYTSGSYVYKFDDIFRFDINSESITKISTMTSDSSRGSVLKVDDEIYYFGGESEEAVFNDIVKFDPSTNISKRVGWLPDDEQGNFSFRKGNSEIVYIMMRTTSNTSTIYEFDTSTYSFEDATHAVDFVGSASIITDNAVYIFRTISSANVEILKVDRVTLATEVVSLNVPAPGSFYPSVAFDGTYAYWLSFSEDRYLPFFVRFHLDTHEWDYINIENPETDGKYWATNPTTVYVDEFNRIYCFGGRIGTSDYRDDIWYIDLNPLSATEEPPTSTSRTTPSPEFSCDGRPDGP